MGSFQPGSARQLRPACRPGEPKHVEQPDRVDLLENGRAPGQSMYGFFVHEAPLLEDFQIIACRGSLVNRCVNEILQQKLVGHYFRHELI